MRILVVEDDVLLADGLVRSLRDAGHAVDWVESAERGLLALDAERIDLLVLDIGLPGIDGLELLRRLRAGERYIPVILVTARDTVNDRVKGLDLGADDYLVKPFAVEELEARVRVLARRQGGDLPPKLVVGPLVLDLVARSASVDDQPLDLTGREWSILEMLATQPRVAQSKERIIQALSTWEESLSPNAIEVYVSRVRAKLEPYGVRIRTVRGFGYRLDPPGNAGPG
jgi:two-component system OmpR family response regulator